MLKSDLMNRARQLLLHSAPGVAVVIVPLATAVPAEADSVGFTYDQSQSFISSGIISGGSHAFGTIHANPQPDGSIKLGGDTLPVPTLSGYTYLPAPLAITNIEHINGLPMVLPDVTFHWTGNFASGSSLTTGSQIAVGYDIGLQELPSPNSTNSFGSLYWSLLIQIYNASPDLDPDGNAIPMARFFIDPQQETISGNFSDNQPMSVTQGGTPDNWSADLVVQWHTPFDHVHPGDGLISDNPGDELSVTPFITLSTSGVSQIPTQPVPLPSAAWVVCEMLSLCGAAWCTQKVVKRREAKSTANS